MALAIPGKEMQLKSQLLELVCFAVLCITLSLRLLSFHSPRNTATWLKNDNGISYARFATVIGFLELPSSYHDSATFATLNIVLLGGPKLLSVRPREPR
jgi:hypothetical protein